jgi:DNA-binding transcriptional regulator GbsR (MarR family)
MTVIEQRMEREIEPTLAVLRRCTAEAKAGRAEQSETTARIRALAEFLEEIHGWYGEMRKLPPATLRSILRAGASITRFMPGARKKGGKA